MLLIFLHLALLFVQKLTRSLKNVQGLYAGDNELLLSSFSINPERDCFDQLKQYAEKMNIRDNQGLLSGEKKIYKLARKSFLVTATDGDDGAFLL